MTRFDVYTNLRFILSFVVFISFFLCRMKLCVSIFVQVDMRATTFFTVRTRDNFSRNAVEHTC